MTRTTIWKLISYGTLALLAAGVIATVVFRPFDVILFRLATPGAIFELLTPLFVITLFLERALEVFITSWRNIGRGDLEAKNARTQQQLNAAKRELDDAPATSDSPAQQTDKEKITKLESKLVERNVAIERYKGETTRVALLLGMSAGVVIAVIGVRVLRPLTDAGSELEGVQGFLFDGLDVIFTAGLLGGGSDGVHQVVTAVTDLRRYIPLRR